MKVKNLRSKNYKVDYIRLNFMRKLCLLNCWLLLLKFSSFTFCISALVNVVLIATKIIRTWYKERKQHTMNVALVW